MVCAAPSEVIEATSGSGSGVRLWELDKELELLVEWLADAVGRALVEEDDLVEPKGMNAREVEVADPEGVGLLDDSWPCLFSISVLLILCDGRRDSVSEVKVKRVSVQLDWYGLITKSTFETVGGKQGKKQNQIASLGTISGARATASLQSCAPFPIRCTDPDIHRNRSPWCQARKRNIPGNKRVNAL